MRHPSPDIQIIEQQLEKIFFDNLPPQAKVLKKLNLHQWMYALSLALQLRDYNVDVLKYFTRIDLSGLLSVWNIILAIPAINLIAPQSHKKLITLSENIVKNSALKLRDYTQENRLLGKIAGAGYLLFISKPAIQAVQNFTSSLPGMPESGFILITLNHVAAVVTLQGAGILSQRAIPEFQGYFDRNPERTLNVLEKSLGFVQSAFTQNPHRHLYNIYLVLTALRSGNELLENYPASIIHTLICMGPISAETLSQMSANLPENFVDEANRLIKGGIDLYTRSPVRLSTQIQQPSIAQQRIQAVSFIGLNYYSNIIFYRLSTYVTYGFLVMAFSQYSLSIPRSAYQALTFFASQYLNEMNSFVQVIAKFIVNVGVIKLTGEVSERMPDILERAAAAIYDFTMISKFRVLAYWDPLKNYELGKQFQQFYRYAEAVAAYEKVPEPTEEDLAENDTLSKLGIQTTQQLVTRFSTIDKPKEHLEQNILTYIYSQIQKAVCLIEIATRELAKREHLPEAEKFIQNAKVFVNQLITVPAAKELYLFKCNMLQNTFDFFRMNTLSLKALDELLSQFHQNYSEKKLAFVEYIIKMISDGIKDFSEKCIQSSYDLSLPESIAKLKNAIRILKPALGIWTMHLRQAINKGAAETTIELLLTSYTNIKEAVDGLEFNLSDCELQNSIENASWKQIQEKATELKKIKNFDSAHRHYRLAVSAIEEQYGKSNAVPFPADADCHKAYYRCIFNCGATLSEVAATVIEPLTQLKLLQQAKGYYKQVSEKAGMITCSDDSQTLLSVYTNLKQKELNLRIKQIKDNLELPQKENLFKALNI